MDFDFKNIIPLIALLAGFLSGSTTLLSLFKSFIKQRKTIEEINEVEFKHALLSADIKLLGRYLDNTLGDITISEYTGNKTIRNKVDNYIQNITNFIGTEEEIKKESAEKTNDKQFLYKDIPNELQDIARELRLGQPWNALAKLRRHIEITLKEVLEENNIPTKEYTPVTKILSILNSINIITAETVSNLRYSISVCNKAIHGVDITDAEAEEAIYHAIKGLEDIKRQKK